MEAFVNNFSFNDTGTIECHILYIDDSPINRSIAKTLFKNWRNTAVCFAKNGIERIEVLKRENIDIVLMDVHMPLMNGLECAIAIRSGQAGHKNLEIPIIAFTTEDTSQARNNVRNAGMDSFLTKSFCEDYLFSEISKICLQNGALTIRP